MKKLSIITLIFLGIVGVFFLAVHFWGENPERLNYEYTPDMARSVAYKAFTPNPFFANGRTEQRPVEGTIARGYLPLHYGLSEAEALRAGRELHNPFTGKAKANTERGKFIFQTYCQPCHGAAGAGDGIVTRHGFPPPPSLLLENARKMKDGQIFYIITFGYKNMPAYDAQVARDDRWQVINYVRKLQESQP